LHKDPTLESVIQRLEVFIFIAEKKNYSVIESLRTEEAEFILEELKKNKKEKPLWSKDMRHFVCPSCSLVLDELRDDYCPQCGKHIDWNKFYIEEE
jgi:rubrerythrin